MQILVNTDQCGSGTGKYDNWSKDAIAMLYPETARDVFVLAAVLLLCKGFKRTWEHWPSFEQLRQGKLGTLTVETKAEPTDYPSCAGC